MKKITNDIIYIGADDADLDLFEGQYIVPNGISYNSYVILDEKIAVMDTVDKRKGGEWLEKLGKALDGRTPDYLVVSHLEPDHSASIATAMKKYPDMKAVMSAKAQGMFGQFFDDTELAERIIAVKEGEELPLGKHTLKFVMAPMVHWPEVMVEYDMTDKVLFAADAFGKFGTLDTDEDWACEARRYYFNIVGKYGAQVQALLKKAAGLDIEKICPLHGPILEENLDYYIGKYNIWSAYLPEDDGVFIAYASMHGNTAEAAEKLAGIFREKGAKKVSCADLSREDMAECIEDAFRYDKLVLAAPTYDGGIFLPMADFLTHIQAKGGLRNKKIAILDNGSWAPMAGKKIREICETFKNVSICNNTVSIKSTVKPADLEKLSAMADELLSL